MIISVVICTYNRASYLKLAIESLLNQTVPLDYYEILVVDNASTDETASLIKKYRDQGVAYLFEPQLGLSRARNTGWKNAKGEWVAYLDDDAVAAPWWVEKLLEFIQTGAVGVGAIAGPIGLVWPVVRPLWLTSRLAGYLGYLDHGSFSRFLDTTEDLVGANCVFRKISVEAVGGFPTDFGRVGTNLLSNEEVLLREAIEQFGGQTYYVAEALVWHHVHPVRVECRWFFRRNYWQGITRARIQFGHPATALSLKFKHLFISLFSVFKWSLISVVEFCGGKMTDIGNVCRLFHQLGRCREIICLIAFCAYRPGKH